MELKSGNVYAAKNPGKISFGLFEKPLINDRIIVWISPDGSRVQYDGPAIKIGQRLPTVSRDAFLKWAGSDVTDIMPEGSWRYA